MTQPVQPGPCSPWATAEDITDCGCDVGTDADFDAAAAAASEILFELSGFQFPGICEQTVRGRARSCWSYVPWPRSAMQMSYTAGCCCPQLSKVRLAGYPVQEILEVTIDGVVVPAEEYEVQFDRELVRLPDADGAPRFWPACNREFLITYQFGLAPPIIGVNAAAQLACEILKACPGAGGSAGVCELPRGTVRVTRQGITVETQALGLWLMGSVRTGMTFVDAFMSVWAKPPAQRQRVSLMVPEQDPWPVRMR